MPGTWIRSALLLAWVGCLTGLPACGDGSGGDAGGKGLSEVPDTLEPGTTIAWNPTLTIVDDTVFEYANDGDSKFTASIEDGTYSYRFENGTGFLTLEGTSAADGKLLSDLPATIELHKGESKIEVSIDGMTFAAEVKAPASDPGEEQPATMVEGTVPSDGEAATVNAALVGSHMLTFGYPQAGAPFDEGETATFVIRADNTLTAMGKTIDSPYTLNGNAAEIIWNDGEHTWALSDNATGTFNEINVGSASTDAWLGQWADASKFEMPMDEGDIGVDVEVEFNGASTNPNIPLAYEMGESVTINWDGAEVLTVQAGAERITPMFVGEEQAAEPAPYGEEDVVRWLRWERGNEIAGTEYVLKLDADDGIRVFEAQAYMTMSGQRYYSISVARRSK